MSGEAGNASGPAGRVYSEETRVPKGSLSRLDAIEASAASAEIRLPSGRMLRFAPGDHGDRLEVRGLGGEVVLRVVVGDDGPIFSFSGGRVELSAESELALRGRTIVVAASEDMSIAVGGNRHTRVAGDERLEASRIEIQANEEQVAIRARENVMIDAELVGLNNELVPAPFPWSSAAEEDQ